MGLPYHTHTFEVPEASADEVSQRLQVSKFITPDKLGTMATADTGDFATAAQGALADSAVQPGDLATVATTGDYSDLSGKPTLGTASAENVGYFATAAQGALADSAVQPADLASYATTAAVAAGYQPLDADLTAWAGVTSSANGRSLVSAADYAAMRALLDLEAGTDFLSVSAIAAGYQPLATVLTNTTASFTTTLETKLNGIASGATANSSDATLLARANHTGTQTASTISDFSTAADARISAAVGVSVQAYDADTAKLDVENQALTGGVTVTSKSLGTQSSGTLTLDMGDRPLQHYTNNGAHTLAPGSVVGACLVDITNGASAGAITTSGWTMVAGDSFTTTNTEKFRCHCSVGDGGSLLIIQALQ